MKNTIIYANKLKKSYTPQLVAVNDVSIKLERGKFYLIKGRSGSGKTTLMHLLSLLDNFDSGEIYINDRSISELSEKEKAGIRSSSFGFVFQAFYLNVNLKAYENVMLPMYVDPNRPKNMKASAIKILEQVGLKDRVQHYPKELSGGEQQRVAIARAIANDPECIFADEPTGNLDRESELIILNLLKSFTNCGKTVVVVSHNEIVESYADQVFIMNDGNLDKVRHDVNI